MGMQISLTCQEVAQQLFMKVTILTIQIHFEEDVVMTRQRSRQIAQALGFDSQDQTRIATAVSEVARNTFQFKKEYNYFLEQTVAILSTDRTSHDAASALLKEALVKAGISLEA